MSKGISIENEGIVFSQQNDEKALVKDKSSLPGLGLKLVDGLSRKLNAKITYELSPTIGKQIVFLKKSEQPVKI